jgi:hypothetical protein
MQNVTYNGIYILLRFYISKLIIIANFKKFNDLKVILLVSYSAGPEKRCSGLQLCILDLKKMRILRF